MAKEGRDEKGRFLVGNLFSVGNNGGRPPKYSDYESMETKIALLVQILRFPLFPFVYSSHAFTNPLISEGSPFVFSDHSIVTFIPVLISAGSIFNNL